jgi:hypothetical protein
MAVGYGEAVFRPINAQLENLLTIIVTVGVVLTCNCTLATLQPEFWEMLHIFIAFPTSQMYFFKENYG